MFKSEIVLEVKGNEERVYKLFVDKNAPLGEIHDILCVMKAHVLGEMQIREDKEKEELESEGK